MSKAMFGFNLRFMAGAVLDDDLYFSALPFNGLMKISLSSGVVNYILSFEDVPVLGTRIHKQCVLWNKWLFFIPQNYSKMHAYNVETGEQLVYTVTDGAEHGMISCAVLGDRKLYLLPQFKTQSAKVFDLTTFSLSVDELFNDWFMKNRPEEPEYLLPRSCWWCGHVYSAFNLDNKIIDYDTLAGTVNYISTDLNKIFGVFTATDGLWVHSRVGKAFQFIGRDGAKKPIHLPSYVGTGRYMMVAPCGEHAYALPCDASVIIKLHSDGSVSQVDYPDDYVEISKLKVSQEKFWGYVNYKDKLLIFPYVHDHMLVIEGDNTRIFPVTLFYDYDETNPFFNIINEYTKAMTNPLRTLKETKLVGLENFIYLLKNERMR